MKILNFGSCNIDYVYSLDHIVRPGETEATSALEIFPGGKGLNQSIAIARAGASVFHAGCIGEDGGMLRELLASCGVDTSYLVSVPGKNGHAVIQLSCKGENSIFLFGGSNEKITEELCDEVLRNFGSGDILLLQNEISCLSYIIDSAQKRGLCIILNPSPLDDALRALDLSKLSYLILNEVEAADLSGSDTAEGALAFFRCRYPDLRVVLTLGERGSVYADAEGELYQPAFLAEVVDTTAAGDTFTGYFVAGLASGAPLSETLRLASAAAAVAVTGKGAAPSIPTRERVLSLLPALRPMKGEAKDERLRRLIESYIGEELRGASLTGLAEHLGYSTVHTGYLCRHLLGVSFSAALAEARCRAAAALLLEDGLSVGEIIRAVGYENESFFRRLFRERYGVTPKKYRQRKGC